MLTKTKSKRKARRSPRQPTLVGAHLIIDPRVCHGQLIFRGTRVPVDTILYCFAKGHSLDYVRKSWPEVSVEAIEEAVRLAAEQLIKHYGARKP